MPLTNKDAIDMGHQAITEIQKLRGIIAELKPKAEAYDILVTVVGLVPKPYSNCEIDLVWKLKDKMLRLNEEINQEEEHRMANQEAELQASQTRNRAPVPTPAPTPVVSRYGNRPAVLMGELKPED